MKRLGTDYIDLIQIHWPDRYVPIFGAQEYDLKQERDAISFEEQLQALKTLVDAGKVRYVGVSNETPYGLMKFCETADRLGLPRICSIQNSFSLITRTQIEQGISEVCSERNENIGLLAYSPLAGGILSGKYRCSYSFILPLPSYSCSYSYSYLYSYKVIDTLTRLYKTMQNLGDRSDGLFKELLVKSNTMSKRLHVPRMNDEWLHCHRRCCGKIILTHRGRSNYLSMRDPTTYLLTFVAGRSYQ